jgi:hypothetical protein
MPALDIFMIFYLMKHVIQLQGEASAALMFHRTEKERRLSDAAGSKG